MLQGARATALDYAMPGKGQPGFERRALAAMCNCVQHGLGKGPSMRSISAHSIGLTLSDNNGFRGFRIDGGPDPCAFET